MLSSGPPAVAGPPVLARLPRHGHLPSSRRGSAVSPGTGPVGPPRSQGRVLHTCGWGGGYVGAGGRGVAEVVWRGRRKLSASGTRRPERDEAPVVEGLHDDAAAIWTACLESLDGAGSTHK